MNFSAAVVGVGPGSAYVVMWSDTAVSFWCPDANARIVGMTAPCAASGGGLEIWRLGAPLSAWFEVNPTVAVPPSGGPPPYGECLLALANPGEFTQLTATLPDRGGTVAMQPVGQGVINDSDTGTGPLFANVSGCPASPRYSYLSDAEHGYYGAGNPYTTTTGTDPSLFAGAYQLWVAVLNRVPGSDGQWPAVVAGTAADGSTLRLDPVLLTYCPWLTVAGAGGVCGQPPPPPPVTPSPFFIPCPDGTTPNLQLYPNTEGCNDHAILKG